ncbi:MAG: transcription elongation factor GreA [Bacteroidetes bacterium]|nr:transcription elongation factor GreA [Bacteroidota bacterium]
MPISTREHSSVSSQPQSNLTIGQAVSGYLSGLTSEERTAAAPVLNNYARWFSVQRQLRSITPPELERYQEQLAAEARTDLSERLEALKAFLLEAKRQKWTDTNLAVEIKIKKSKASSKTAKAPRAPRRVVNLDTSNGDAIRMTREGRDKLAEELEHLETAVRSEIAHDLKTAAADKDFRENAPYDVAKQHQGEVEARIRELKRILETGEVVDVVHSHIIDLGSKVTLLDLIEKESIIYTLVGPGEIDPRNGRISIQSPVGRALSGKMVGDEVDIEVPAGVLRLRVERVEMR